MALFSICALFLMFSPAVKDQAGENSDGEGKFKVLMIKMGGQVVNHSIPLDFPVSEAVGHGVDLEKALALVRLPIPKGRRAGRSSRLLNPPTQTQAQHVVINRQRRGNTNQATNRGASCSETMNHPSWDRTDASIHRRPVPEIAKTMKRWIHHASRQVVLHQHDPGQEWYAMWSSKGHPM